MPDPDEDAAHQAAGVIGAEDSDAGSWFSGEEVVEAYMCEICDKVGRLMTDIRAVRIRAAIGSIAP